MTATARAGIRKSIGTLSGGEGFDDYRGTLAATDAGAAQAVSSAAAAERVQQVQGDPSAAGAEWMANGNGTPIDVGALPIQAQLLFDCKILGGERFVHFAQIHVIGFQSGP